MNQARKTFIDNESGAVAVYVAILLVVLLGAGALTLDIAHLAAVKRELVKAGKPGPCPGPGASGRWISSPRPAGTPIGYCRI